MKRLVGVIGSGNIGRDPFHACSWSGSSRSFFNACIKRNMLTRAFGVEVPSYLRYPLLLKNFSTDKKVWREKFYQDTVYYDLLTREIDKHIQPSDFQSDFIQIGAIYDVPGLVRGKTRCFSYHDGDYMNAVRSPYRKNLISKHMEQQALGYAHKVYHGLDKIFVMSDYLRQSLIEGYKLDPSRVKTIGAGINFTFPPLTTKHYNKKNLLFIGIDFKRKGGEFILLAFAKIRERVPEAELHIVGPEKVSVDEHLNKGVVFHGFIPKTHEGKQKFREILAHSALFVLASEYEPFGIAPLEAMSNKIPCLLPNQWAFPEMVTPGFNGELFELGNDEDFIEKAVKLLHLNESDLVLMGDNARQTVENRFTWDIVVDRLKQEIS